MSLSRQQRRAMERQAVKENRNVAKEATGIATSKLLFAFGMVALKHYGKMKPRATRLEVMFETAADYVHKMHEGTLTKEEMELFDELEKYFREAYND